MTSARNLVSVSSAPAARFGDKKYYDLVGTVEVLKRILQESVIDGFELQLLPEWDNENPPLTDGQFADWTEVPKYKTVEILDLMRKENLPILSVHASRDIGNYLCSAREEDLSKASRLIFDSLSIGQNLGSKICVFHLWDTWKTKFDFARLKEVFSTAAAQFPGVKASVENIPTHLAGHTPFTLVETFDYVTLDLRWAAMHNELDRFKSILDKIVNVHLRGRLEGSRWFLDQSSFGFYEALDKIKNQWRYSGLLTVEPEGPRDSSLFRGFLEAMHSLRE